MQIGVVFPQTELGGDVGAVRAYGQGAEALGFRHLLAYDHVVGADPAVYPGWDGPYDLHTTFHEPFVMFGYLAAVTQLELAPEAALLADGRFRLGLGIGWNRVEYEALGQDFGTRGRRLDEQIDLLRRLWTEESVTYDGRFDQIKGGGLAPLPVQRPIPLWLRGH